MNNDIFVCVRKYTMLVCKIYVTCKKNIYSKDIVSVVDIDGDVSTYLLLYNKHYRNKFRG